jgi:alginate O-acetyltransferase complex protein AlgI
MLFNSYIFLFVFLPVVLAGYFLLGRISIAAAAAWLTLSSLLFYGWWDYHFVPLLLGSITCNFVASRLMTRLERGRMVVLAIAVAGNLGLLGYFKYAGFFAGALDQAFGTGLGPLNIILPIGISFYTFTQIAFLVDAGRGEVAHYSFIHYALFVTYFPHLIAGPILHHREMMPQFRSPAIYRVDMRLVALGLGYLAIGLGKKCLIADSFSAFVGATFDSAAKGAELSAPAAWRGVVAYTLQLYFDFSGYADMAIGISLLFGIRLPFNFNSPYKSASIIEFWRRWHMTLSRFLRDYLYVALGGNRRGGFRRYLNLMITMALGGLWHGANWTFVVWGLLHGGYLIVNHAWRTVRPNAIERVPAPLRRYGAIGLTFLCVMIGWVFFRAQDIPTAMRVLSAMMGANGFGLAPAPIDLQRHLVWLALRIPIWLSQLIFFLGALYIVFAMPNTQELLEKRQTEPGRDGSGLAGLVGPQISPRWAVALGVLAAAAAMTFVQTSEFLYFQF